MRRLARFFNLFLLLTVAGVFAPPIHAQEAASPFLAVAKVDRSQFPLVQVAVYGDPVNGGIGELPVELREQGQVQTVLSDTTATVGVQLAVVLDPYQLSAAGSSGQSHQAEVAGVLLDLIEQEVVVRNQDWLAAFTVDADGGVQTIQDWTGEPNLIFNSTVQTGVEAAVDDKQLTALMEDVLDRFQAPPPANFARAMLLLTAGSSQLDVETAVARANGANVHIHVVELADPAASAASAGALRDLALRTNGAYVRLQSAEDLPPLWRRLAALRTQRVLTYESSAAGPAPLTVELAPTGGAPLVAGTEPTAAAAPQQAAPSTDEAAPAPEAAVEAATETAAQAAPATAAQAVAPTPAAPTPAANDAAAASEAAVSVAASQPEQPAPAAEPAALAGDGAAAPGDEVVFVPGTSLALPRPLLEMALPILLILLAFFAYRELRDRRTRKRQARAAAATAASPVTSPTAARDDVDELQPLLPSRLSSAGPVPAKENEREVVEPAAMRAPARAAAEEDDYDEATVVPLRFSDEEATYRLGAAIDLPLLGVLVRVTNDPNLPQQLPVYGLNSGPGEVRQIHIGRHSKNNTVVINDKSISREHAVIIQKDGRLYLRDNASTAGTYLNWRQLKPGEELLLRHNDLIGFGEIVYELRARGEDEATVVSG